MNSNSNNTASISRSIISIGDSNNSNNSISRSTRSQCLKRKLESEALKWAKLYNDLLLSIIQYCDLLTLTQLVIRINQYWNTTAKSTRVWNNRLIQFIAPYNLDEFELFIRTHPYLINSTSWYWDRSGYHFNSADYRSFRTILQSQSTAFNQLKSIEFNGISLSKLAMIILCTSFNSLISLSFNECYISYSALNLLSTEQFELNSNNNNNNNNSSIMYKPNRLISELKSFELVFLNGYEDPVQILDYSVNYLHKLIELESLIVMDCGLNQLIYNNTTNTPALEFYSTVLIHMPKLTYLKTDESKIESIVQFKLYQFNAISQLIQRLEFCTINIPTDYGLGFNSSDWINILKLQSSSINNTSPLQHIKLQYSAELIDYLVQFPALTRLEIASDNISITDIKSLSTLSSLTELCLITRLLNPLIFIELQSLTKLKILVLVGVGEIDPNIKYSILNELLIELLKCNSLIELYLYLTIHYPLKPKIQPPSIRIELIEFIDLLSKFTKLKFLYISESTIEYFCPRLNFNKRCNNKQLVWMKLKNKLIKWYKELNRKLSIVLPNTVIKLDLDLDY